MINIVHVHHEPQAFDVNALIALIGKRFHEAGTDPVHAIQLAVQMVEREIYEAMALDSLDRYVHMRLEALDRLMEESMKLIFLLRRRSLILAYVSLGCAGMAVGASLSAMLKLFF